MVRLTEDMIVARTRVSDMNHVKKLNCWGAELSDISVIRQLGNVEVLSLSVNTISTLADIQYCKNLQELYIRKNQIPDIGEILWLRELPRLRNLWLEENPCAESCGQELYRQTVIRTLPQLQKLDNVAVSSEEMAEAMRRGLELGCPGDRLPEEGDRGQVPDEGRRSMLQQEEAPPSRRMVRTPPVYQEARGAGYQEESQQGRRDSVLSPSRRVSNQVFPEEGPVYSPSLQGPGRWEASDGWEEGGRREEGARRPSVARREEEQTEYQRGFGALSPTGPRRGATPEDQRRPSRAEQREEEAYRGSTAGSRASYSGPPSAEPPYYRGQEASRSPQAHPEAQAIVDQHYNATYRQVDQQLELAQQLVAQRRTASPQRPYPVRPKNRNSNVLSAILCLIKEIDGPSLEVVEMAVRCRMEELED